MICIFVPCYNEELLLPYFIRFYRNRFSKCKIIIYDNYSEDNTEIIAKKYDCEVIKYDSENELRDDILVGLKNNCWKNSETNWNIICDIDEFLDINMDDLLYESSVGTNIISSVGWDMFNENPNSKSIETMNIGVRNINYDKNILFNKNCIKNINYDPGCHICNPKSHKKNNINYSQKKYNLYHMKFINEEIILKKNLRNLNRMSKQNMDHDWGFHYKATENDTKQFFIESRKIGVKKNFII